MLLRRSRLTRCDEYLIAIFGIDATKDWPSDGEIVRFSLENSTFHLRNGISWIRPLRQLKRTLLGNVAESEQTEKSDQGQYQQRLMDTKRTTSSARAAHGQLYSLEDAFVPTACVPRSRSISFPLEEDCAQKRRSVSAQEYFPPTISKCGCYGHWP